MSGIRYWAAPVSLFLLQASPVGVVQDSAGRLRLAFGAEFGRYEEREVSCSGEILDRHDVDFTTVGGEVEYWATPAIRVAGHAGSMSSDPARDPPLAQPFDGLFGGAMVAAEGRVVGGGIGLAGVPDAQEDVAAGEIGTTLRPMGYLRFASLDGVHVRVEVGGPAAPGGPPDILRIGLGFGLGHRRRLGGAITFGASEFPVGGDNPSAVHARLLVPVGGPIDLGVAGAVREGGGNIGVMGRVHLARPRSP